jgi:hypothetical protein
VTNLKKGTIFMAWSEEQRAAARLRYQEKVKVSSESEAQPAVLGSVPTGADTGSYSQDAGGPVGQIQMNEDYYPTEIDEMFPVMYVWAVPLQGNPCYTLRIVVDGAADVAQARTAALAHRPLTDGRTEDEETHEIKSGSRLLTLSECEYIKRTDPDVIRNSDDIPLEYDDALRINARLSAKQETVDRAYAELTDAGIDPTSPIEWRDQQIAETNAAIARADEGSLRQNAIAIKLLLDARAANERALVAIGWQKPNYHGVVVVGDPASYPELAGATFVQQDPTKAVSSKAREAIARLVQRDGYIEQIARGYMIAGGQVDDYGSECMFAAVDAIRAIVGV